MKVPAELNISLPPSCTAVASCWQSETAIAGIVEASLGMISARFFKITNAAVLNDSANSSAVIEPVKKLSHAAFAEFTDPSIVDAASFAVVPVIPISSWMIWIASVTSAKESIDRSAISPFASLTLLASAISRSISVFVPPYPSFRLSSIV